MDRLTRMRGLIMLLLAFISGCKESIPPEPFQQSNVEVVLPQKVEVVSPQKKAYLEAVNDYNDFIDHPKGHVYNVAPKERRLELCYLSAQAVITATKVPEFASDVNSDGEIKEWRAWIDIRKHVLHC